MVTAYFKTLSRIRTCTSLNTNHEWNNSVTKERHIRLPRVDSDIQARATQCHTVTAVSSGTTPTTQKFRRGETIKLGLASGSFHIQSTF